MTVIEGSPRIALGGRDFNALSPEQQAYIFAVLNDIGCIAIAPTIKKPEIAVPSSETLGMLGGIDYLEFIELLQFSLDKPSASRIWLKLDKLSNSPDSPISSPIIVNTDELKYSLPPGKGYKTERDRAKQVLDIKALIEAIQQHSLTDVEGIGEPTYNALIYLANDLAEEKAHELEKSKF